MKRTLLLALSWIVAAFAAFALSAHAAELEVGKQYTLVNPPVTPSNPGKIEVIEFFSYGCPHCSEFNPLVHEWAAKLPKDVSIRRVPISFGRPAWARLAKIYYALEATGDLDKLDADVFFAIHKQGNGFATEESIVKWVASKGIDAKKFSDAFNSFSINSQVQRGDQEGAAYRIQGVPAIVVDGRYLVINEGAGGYAGLLSITDGLIAKARSEKRKK